MSRRVPYLGLELTMHIIKSQIHLMRSPFKQIAVLLLGIPVAFIVLLKLLYRKCALPSALKIVVALLKKCDNVS